jgi:hypothetical protein
MHADVNFRSNVCHATGLLAPSEFFRMVKNLLKVIGSFIHDVCYYFSRRTLDTQPFHLEYACEVPGRHRYQVVHIGIQLFIAASLERLINRRTRYGMQCAVQGILSCGVCTYIQQTYGGSMGMKPLCVPQRN